MAITLGKLTILVGAGVLGSVLAKEGRASDLLSGAFRIAFRQLKQGDSGKSGSSMQKPNNDLLLAQVNSLRQELQILASSNRSVTIVTATQAGTGKYGIVVITFVLGYGYIRWKGWKLPDMMFATRRSLSDACNSISKQLELVYSSIAVTKRKLSSQIDGIDQILTETLETTSSTRQEVSELRGRADDIRLGYREVHETLQTIESKIMSIEGRQEITTKGIMRLCDVARNLEYEQMNQSQALPSSSSRQAIELLPSSPSGPGIALISEPESPSYSNGSRTDGNGISKALGASDDNGVSNGNGASEEPGNATTSSGIFGMRFPGSRGPIFSRTLSASAANILDQTRPKTSQRL